MTYISNPGPLEPFYLTDCTVDPVIEALVQVWDANPEVVLSHFTPNTQRVYSSTHVEVVVTDVDGDQTKSTHIHPICSKLISLPRFDAALVEDDRPSGR